MGGNSALYIKLLKKFSQTNGKAVEHLRDAFNLNDLKHANELAHGIKGVAANLGMNDLSDAAAKLESWDGCKDTEAWQPLLDQFELCLNTVLQAIEHLEQGMNKTATVVPDKDIAAIDKQKLSKLLKALESSLETDLGTASKHAEALSSMLVNTEYDEMFRRLEEQIDNFDSDGAREVIHAIEEGTGCGDLL
jgi:HPt (histidine-containing phosphotransfer) domain-containing protein